MTTHQFRILCYFCCVMSAVLVGSAVVQYIAQKQWVQQVNTPERVAISGEIEFRAPVAMSNAMGVSGLFLALGACFWMKASHARKLELGVEETTVED